MIDAILRGLARRSSETVTTINCAETPGQAAAARQARAVTCDVHGLLVRRQRADRFLDRGIVRAPDQVAGTDARGVDDAVAEAQFDLAAGQRRSIS